MWFTHFIRVPRLHADCSFEVFTAMSATVLYLTSVSLFKHKFLELVKPSRVRNIFVSEVREVPLVGVHTSSESSSCSCRTAVGTFRRYCRTARRDRSQLKQATHQRRAPSQETSTQNAKSEICGFFPLCCSLLRRSRQCSLSCFVPVCLAGLCPSVLGRCFREMSGALAFFSLPTKNRTFWQVPSPSSIPCFSHAVFSRVRGGSVLVDMTWRTSRDHHPRHRRLWTDRSIGGSHNERVFRCFFAQLVRGIPEGISLFTGPGLLLSLRGIPLFDHLVANLSCCLVYVREQRRFVTLGVLVLLTLLRLTRRI